MFISLNFNPNTLGCYELTHQTWEPQGDLWFKTMCLTELVPSRLLEGSTQGEENATFVMDSVADIGIATQ